MANIQTRSSLSATYSEARVGESLTPYDYHGTQDAPPLRSGNPRNQRRLKTIGLPLQMMNDNVFEQLIEEEIGGVTADTYGEAAIGSASAGRRNGDHAWFDEE
jgi:hypothetical protein